MSGFPSRWVNFEATHQALRWLESSYYEIANTREAFAHCMRTAINETWIIQAVLLSVITTDRQTQYKAYGEQIALVICGF